MLGYVESWALQVVILIQGCEAAEIAGGVSPPAISPFEAETPNESEFEGAESSIKTRFTSSTRRIGNDKKLDQGHFQASILEPFHIKFSVAIPAPPSHPQLAVLTVQGDLDIETFPRLLRQAEACFDQGQFNLLIDLSQAGSISDGGLIVLQTIAARSELQGGKTAISGTSVRTADLINLTGFAGLTGFLT